MRVEGRVAGSSMACKGSGVQIPSAPPQVRSSIEPRPYPDRPPRAANWQQSALKGRSSVRYDGAAGQHRWRCRGVDPASPGPAAWVVRDEESDQPGTARSITGWRADLIRVSALNVGRSPPEHLLAWGTLLPGSPRA